MVFRVVYPLVAYGKKHTMRIFQVLTHLSPKIKPLKDAIILTY